MTSRRSIRGKVCKGVAAMAGLLLALPGAVRAEVTARKSSPSPAISTLRPGERLVLFTTVARPSPTGEAWIVPIHGWISRPVSSRWRLGAMEQVLAAATGRRPDAATRANFTRRANLMLADNLGGRRIVLRLGDATFALPPSASHGHFRSEINVPATNAAKVGRDGRLIFTAVLQSGDQRAFAGAALLQADDGVSVISDIDDTVKITHVTDRGRMLAATFLDDFAAVPAMAALYRDWAADGATFHFVSSSPWHLYQPLIEMLEEAGFPFATLALKRVRLKDRTALDLFKPGSVTKPPVIAALLAAHPKRRFVLVGDSGEEDPEVYADVLRRHGDRIPAVYIRNVTAARADDARFSRLFAGIDPSRWRLFADPSELPRRIPRSTP